MKAGREKKVPHIQGKTDQVCSRPIHRNLSGQKGVAGYIQCAESENMQPRILYPARLSLEIGEIGPDQKMEAINPVLFYEPNMDI